MLKHIAFSRRRMKTYSHVFGSFRVFTVCLERIITKSKVVYGSRDLFVSPMRFWNSTHLKSVWFFDIWWRTLIRLRFYDEVWHLCHLQFRGSILAGRRIFWAKSSTIFGVLTSFVRAVFFVSKRSFKFKCSWFHNSFLDILQRYERCFVG